MSSYEILTLSCHCVIVSDLNFHWMTAVAFNVRLQNTQTHTQMQTRVYRITQGNLQTHTRMHRQGDDQDDNDNDKKNDECDRILDDDDDGDKE